MVQTQVQTECLSPGKSIPLLVRPIEGPLDLVAWAADNLEFVETQVLKHGALLFRNFTVNGCLDLSS
jgi:hypothetical protein